ncbi:TonB-dependent receptor [Pseudoduganella namucuonensis]|uniref:Outer membrane receptor for ferrienterochelin and colicins n=1 Tax=Pseudoduganella namucuonensis TaxID=1035707 RepID=A0A1I7H9E8_9BURK|nr:TonB-dependent receptor [Pseudoduganella namucuonensis]SFU57156.1 Outer membrane receptor for ferrienterochelin and colicins [Pseudoduganella namucuonensis]
MQSRLCALAAALACHASASAQEVQKVQVTGAKYDQRRQDTASTIVLGAEELRRQGDRTLAEVLRRVAGITVGDGAGKGGEIRMRGLGNGYTQILLNGTAAPAGFAIDALSPDLIERVEILRTASSELGAQSIAGTINIILRKGAPRASKELKPGMAWAGGERRPSLSLLASDKVDALSWSVAATASQTGEPDDTVYRETVTAPDGTLVTDRLNPVHERNKGLSLNITPRLNWSGNGDAWSLQGYITPYKRTTAVDARETLLAGEYSAVPRNGRRVDLRGVLLRGDLEWRRALASGAKLEAKLGGLHNPRGSDYEFHSMAGGVRSPDLRRVRSDIDESGATFSGKYVAPAAGGHALALGWDTGHTERSQSRMEHDFMLAADIAELYDGTIRRAALYAQDDWDIAPAWSLSAGLRWESLATRIAGTGVAEVARRSSIPAPTVQLLYKPTPRDQFRAGLARTYKAPAMLDLIPRRYTVDNNNTQTNPDTRGNPALRPETAWGMDVAYDHYPAKDGLLGASAYLRRIDDVTLPLLLNEGGRWVRTPSNQGRADAWGVALEAKGALGPAFTGRASLARNWSRVAAVAGPDNRLDRQPKLTASVGLDYKAGDAFKAGADFSHQSGGRARVSAQLSSVAPAQRKLDLYAVWSLAAATRLRLGASNLLRRDTQAVQAYAGPAGTRRVEGLTSGYATLRAGIEHNW